MCVVPTRCLAARFTICMKNSWGWKSDEIKSLGRTRQPICSLGETKRGKKAKKNKGRDSPGQKLLKYEVITETRLFFSPFNRPNAWISRQNCVRCSKAETLGWNRLPSEVRTCWCLGPGCLMFRLLPDSCDGPSSNSTWRGQRLRPHQSQAIT